MNQNYFEPNLCYDSNSFGFDQPPQYTIDHQEDLNQQKPEDSLIIGNEELNTIPEKESNEFIKSSVEDLVPIPITPLSNSNEDEYFTPGDDVELLLHHDPSIPKMSAAFILKGFTDEPPLEENDDLEYKNDEWKKILYDA
uniref:Reverse transcriptase domain-containing protein n=1 Tax=Tanacetum cinerariifolium TaxID=118510 RepID=A0A699I8G3_TANCI|nr:hypothetical protein [Tanacetum cinerariifolium]